MAYCKKCGDKLELISVVGTITKFQSGGLFSDGGVTWENTTFGYCDNVDCDLYGIFVKYGINSEGRRKIKVTPTSSPDEAAPTDKKDSKEGNNARA